MQWSKHLDAIRGAGTGIVGPTTETRIVINGDKSYTRVDADADRLAQLSRYPRDIYYTARCISSEVGSARAPEYHLSVAEAIRNEAAATDWKTPTRMLVQRVSAGYEFTRGWFGEQHGRWSSTSRDPYKKAIVAAQAVMAEQTNFTNGARRWYSPRVQDGGKQGTRELRYDAVGIAEKWGAEGWIWIGSLPNVVTYDHALFRRNEKGAATDNAMLVTAIKEGRDGKVFNGDTVATEKGIPLWLAAVGVWSLNLF